MNDLIVFIRALLLYTSMHWKTDPNKTHSSNH